MTVFVRVMKELIIAAVEEMKTTSIAADSYYSYWRDLELSKNQRTTLDALQQKIEGLSPCESDETNLRALQTHIQKAYETIAAYHMEKKKTNGTTYEKLTSLNTVVGNVHAALLSRFANPSIKITSASASAASSASQASSLVLYKEQPGSRQTLLDLADDGSAFHQFCYHAITYIAKKIYQQSIRSYLAETSTRLLSPVPPLEIQGDKEKRLRSELWTCYQLIEGLDKSQPNYLTNLKESVLMTINVLIGANIEICSDPKTRFTFPIPGVSSIGIFSLTTASLFGTGDFGLCMERAKKELKQEASARSLMDSHP